MSKPRVGKIVDYYNPSIVQRIGRIDGYGGRGAGPYAALVTNNEGHGLTLSVFLPGVAPLEVTAATHESEPREKDKGYWEFQTPIENGKYTAAAKAAD